MSRIWNNDDAQETILQAMNRQRVLFEQHVGPLELFRDGWSPNDKSLIDILYGFSTVLGISPTRFMVRGFLQREMDVVGQGTPLAGLKPGERSALLNAFFDDVRYGGADWELRRVLTLLKRQEVSSAFERQMASASSSGALSVDDSGREPKGAEPQNETRQTFQRVAVGQEHTKMTTVALAGGLLLLIHVLNLFTEAERLPEFPSQSVVADPGYEQVVASLIRELELSDVRVKGVAFSALGQIGNMREEVIETLSGWLGSDNSQDRRNAAWAIARNVSGAQEQGGQRLIDSVNANPDLLSSLKRAVDDPAPRVACNAALALGGLGSTAKGVASNLEKRLSDPNVASTFKLALACIQQQGEGAKAQLAERIGSEDPLLGVGLSIERRDFGGFDFRGGGGECMCTFS